MKNNNYTIRYVVDTINGKVTVDSIIEALAYFEGAINDFKKDRDEVDAKLAMYSYLLISGKITPVKAY